MKLFVASVVNDDYIYRCIELMFMLPPYLILL